MQSRCTFILESKECCCYTHCVSFLKDSIVCTISLSHKTCAYLFLLLPSMEAPENSAYMKKSETKKRMGNEQNVCESNMTHGERPWIKISIHASLLFGFLAFVLHHLRYLIYMVVWLEAISFTLTFNFDSEISRISIFCFRYSLF